MQPEVLQNIGPNFHVSATSEVSEQVFHLFLKVLVLRLLSARNTEIIQIESAGATTINYSTIVSILGNASGDKSCKRHSD